MNAGKTWRPEFKDEADPVTGTPVRQLTDYLGHSNHPYFTHPGWYQGGKKLVFASDRNNQTDLFSLALDSGEITQLTDVSTLDTAGGKGWSCHAVAVNAKRPEVYAWLEKSLYAVNRETFEARRLFGVPEGFRPGSISVTADGANLCFGISEDLSKRIHMDLGHGYVGMYEIWAARPHCRIMKLSVDGGKPECVHEEEYWIGHINTSPTRPDLLTYCHEGSWHLVDNRIWGLNLSSGETWPIRPLDRPGRIGHEYWMADGEHIGYHGSWPTPESAGKRQFVHAEYILGRIRYDNTNHLEFTLAEETGHTHSLDFTRIVGDGGNGIWLWECDGKQLSGPRLLCEHRSLKGHQRGHPHPAFSPDGCRVLFTSSRTGYSNLYLVEAPKAPGAWSS